MVSVKKSRNSSTVGNHELLKGVDGDGSNCVADPFSNEILLGPFDWARLAVGSVVLMPVRAIAVILTLVMSWVVAKIGLFGLDATEVDCSYIPRQGWRLQLMKFYAFFGRIVFWSAGFWITIKGKQASREEASILVGAPHSTFLDSLIIIMSGCSPVSRHENRHAFLISACQLFYQTIFVDRRSKEGRVKAIEEISLRAKSKDMRLPQVFICPEGTNTNRQALIQFKIGAFAPGVPVQPVVIRYPGYDNRNDAVTWTFHQNHSYLFSVWYLLSNLINRVEVEFLPVYKPSLEEKTHPELFAKNVQACMAKALGVPATDITYSKYYEEYCRATNTLSPEQELKLKKSH